MLANLQTQICSLFVELSHIRNLCKLALLKSLYKKGSKPDPKSFLPTKLLPIVTKIVGKIILY